MGERATYLIKGAKKWGGSAKYEDVQFLQGQCGDYQRKHGNESDSCH